MFHGGRSSSNLPPQQIVEDLSYVLPALQNTRFPVEQRTFYAEKVNLRKVYEKMVNLRTFYVERVNLRTCYAEKMNLRTFYKKKVNLRTFYAKQRIWPRNPPSAGFWWESSACCCCRLPGPVAPQRRFEVLDPRFRTTWSSLLPSFGTLHPLPGYKMANYISKILLPFAIFCPPAANGRHFPSNSSQLPEDCYVFSVQKVAFYFHFSTQKNPKLLAGEKLTKQTTCFNLYATPLELDSGYLKELRSISHSHNILSLFKCVQFTSSNFKWFTHQWMWLEFTITYEKFRGVWNWSFPFEFEKENCIFKQSNKAVTLLMFYRKEYEQSVVKYLINALFCHNTEKRQRKSPNLLTSRESSKVICFRQYFL